MHFRRYELLLPLKFNDGLPVPDELIHETVLEIRQEFGDLSCETQIIQGHWHYKGQLLLDDMVRLFVDVPDLPEHRAYFLAFKERAKARFRQFDLWMTTFPLEVL